MIKSSCIWVYAPQAKCVLVHDSEGAHARLFTVSICARMGAHVFTVTV